MLTKKDKEEIKDIVVDVIQDVVIPAFETVNTRIGGLEYGVKTLEHKFENLQIDITTKLDQVYGEIREVRLEQTTHSQLHEDINQTLTSHQSRISNLESRTSY